MSNNNIALLGPEYSYSHLAGMKAFPDKEIILCDRIEQVFQTVTAKKTGQGIIPLENMLEGSVRESIKNFLRYQVKINKAYTMPIHHCLAAQDQNYEVIASHAQALAQCSGFVKKQRNITAEECASTAKAMSMAAANKKYAAIGSREAAEYQGLPILYQNIEDNPDNVTKFVAISLEETLKEENLKTSLLLKPKEDKPGLLFNLLAPFALKNINLGKIESLPSGRKMGEYVFYLEIEGNVREEKVKSALDFLQDLVDVYSLGSYEVVDLQ
ncbi:MAG: prephenate dehydratase domain-containing protein [Nanoarchaeota archaeon]|nr:prephenate dehydratase domain-containing protein [Nanoarchaeota archaeon]